VSFGGDCARPALCGLLGENCLQDTQHSLRVRGSRDVSGICHSLDYITMQPRVSKTQWTATVNKMINVMAAPIPKSDAQIIIEYLAEHYGTGK
jgi:hypothetical protein